MAIAEPADGLETSDIVRLPPLPDLPKSQSPLTGFVRETWRTRHVQKLRGLQSPLTGFVRETCRCLFQGGRPLQSLLMGLIHQTGTSSPRAPWANHRRAC